MKSEIFIDKQVKVRLQMTERRSDCKMFVKGQVKMSRTKEKEERMDEISTAAKKVFFKKGYFNSTVEEIAKLAGVSKGTVYLYFKNKDELYVSLVMPMIEELTRLLMKFESDIIENKIATGHDLIMGFYRLFCNLFKFDPEGVRIFQVYLSSDLFPVMPKKTRNRLWMTGKRNIRIADSIITNAIKLKVLPEINPKKLFSVLWSSFLGTVLWEDSRYRISGKNNYLFDSLEQAFTLVSKGLGLCANKD